MEIKPKKIVIVEPLVQQEDPPETVIPQALQLNIEEILQEEDPIPELVELNKQVVTCMKPESECVIDITANWGKFTDSESIKKAINDLFIRFNTSPKTYTKHDYLLLLQLLYKGLTYLYEDYFQLGPNFSKVATITDRVLDFNHPLATHDTEVRAEDASTTIPTVDYLNSYYVLRWEEF